MTATDFETISLSKLTDNITCSLCSGYFIDATTLTKCLHTFCKSCIVKYLEHSNACPQCGEVIHQTNPLNFIKFDQRIQDIVYKLVPGLELTELERQREFYESHGLPSPLDEQLENAEEKASKDERADFKGVTAINEQVSLFLDCPFFKTLDRQYVRVSALATVKQVKKFISQKVFNTTEHSSEIEIFCNEELLRKEQTLKFVFLTQWKDKDSPLTLELRPTPDLRQKWREGREAERRKRVAMRRLLLEEMPN